ncbi:hypothetical protein GSbR_42570 [Geobacter sp. SVR]|nr:hypothetical protein GSVR_27340 [Geobacter sp. SVR]GCF87657.1 hypothetical protein GSbR_42570 [Geobacter sp. SVR]
MLCFMALYVLLVQLFAGATAPSFSANGSFCQHIPAPVALSLLQPRTYAVPEGHVRSGGPGHILISCPSQVFQRLASEEKGGPV